jgi:uncharacterized protein
VKTETFVRRSRIAAPAEELYRWHASPGALAKLVPPWEPVEVLTGADGLEEGKEVRLRVRLGPLRLLWVSRLLDCAPGRASATSRSRGRSATGSTSTA